MQSTPFQGTLPFIVPAEISSVDQEFLLSRLRYERQRREQALKLRRQLVKQRSLFQRRLNRALSAQLRAELNIQIRLDATYLQRPGFVGVFEVDGVEWRLNFQPSPWGGRWYFRAADHSRLYACAARHLETQLCYALGQRRLAFVEVSCV